MKYTLKSPSPLIELGALSIFTAKLVPRQIVGKVNVINLGCSKNQVDSESILGEFSNAGYAMTSEQKGSDIVVINTCGFIDSAKEESINEILTAVENRDPGQKIVVAGCLSQRYTEELKKDIPEADLVMGTYKAGEIIKSLDLTVDPQALCDTGAFTKRILLEEQHHHAYLKLAEGCNRTCSFCAIPGMRGKQRSRNIASLVDEANELASKGVKEISLIAQDLTYFGREKGGPSETLEQLLNALVTHTDIPWIRMMYAYPGFINDSLMDLMAQENRICSYLDMPLQHGSDNILKLMRRGHTRKSLLGLLRKLRQRIPNIALRTTLLIGHPGETEDDVKQLLDLIEEVRFDRLGCFTYSDEDGTHAFDLNNQRVDIEVAQERAERVMNVQQHISLENNEARIGQELDVLIDEVAEGSDFHFYGRTQWDAPEVDNRVQILNGNAAPGDFVKVKVLSASEYDLDAEII